MALTCSDPLREGLTEQWPGASHTEDHAAANAQRLQLGASPPQKKFTQSCSSSISGIVVNHNTHLAHVLVPTPVNVAVLQGLLGPLPVGKPHSLYQMFSQQGNCLSQCGLRTPWTSLPASGDSPLPPEHCQVLSRGISDYALPLFIAS